MLHRRLHAGASSHSDARNPASRFSGHIEDGLWKLIPASETLLGRTSALIMSAPGDLLMRTADAVHLTTALEAGERDVWTNHRHMLRAAGSLSPKFGERAAIRQ